LLAHSHLLFASSQIHSNKIIQKATNSLDDGLTNISTDRSLAYPTQKHALSSIRPLSTQSNHPHPHLLFILEYRASNYRLVVEFAKVASSVVSYYGKLTVASVRVYGSAKRSLPLGTTVCLKIYRYSCAAFHCTKPLQFFFYKLLPRLFLIFIDSDAFRWYVSHFSILNSSSVLGKYKGAINSGTNVNILDNFDFFAFRK
jgi:hypothetical protein